MIACAKCATLYECMKYWTSTTRKILAEGLLCGLIVYVAYLLLSPAESYSVVPHAYGPIVALSDHQLIVQIKNTDTFYPSYPKVINRVLTYDDNTIVTKQRFLSQDGTFIDATPPSNVPATELQVGQTVYVFFDAATGYANRIYVGEPTLPF
jgi:hypothetical protein